MLTKGLPLVVIIGLRVTRTRKVHGVVVPVEEGTVETRKQAIHQKQIQTGEKNHPEVKIVDTTKHINSLLQSFLSK